MPLFRCLCLWVVIILINIPAIAQIGLPETDYFPPREYERHNVNAGPQVFEVARDAQGRLVFEAGDRLVGWNGLRWEVIAGSEGLLKKSLGNMPDGRIAVGAADELGMLRADPQGKLSYHSFLQHVPDSLKSGFRVVNVLKSGAETIFVGEDQLFVWDGKNMQVEPTSQRWYRGFEVDGQIVLVDWRKGLFVRERNASRLLTDATSGWKVKYAGPAAGGMVLVTRKQGAYHFDGETLKPLPGILNAQLTGFNVMSASRIGEDLLVMATYGGGIFIADLDGNLILHWDESNGFPENLAIAVSNDGDEGVWLGTSKGLLRLQLPGRLSYFGDAQGIRDNVTTIMRKGDELLAGTLSGIFRLGEASDGRPKAVDLQIEEGFVHDFAVAGDEVLAASGKGLYALGNAPPRRIFPDIIASIRPVRGLQNEYWAGSRGRLLRIDYRGKLTIADSIDVPETMRAIFESANGELWTAGDQLHRVARDGSGRLASVTTLDSTQGWDPEMFPVSMARAFGKDLFLTSRGLYEWDGGQMQPSDLFGEEIGRLPIELLEPIDENSAWLYADRKLGLIQRREGGWAWDTIPFLSLQEDHVRSLYQDGEILWIGTDEGLFRYDTTVRQRYDIPPKLLLNEVLAGDTNFLPVNGNSVELSSALNDIRFQFASPDLAHREALRYSWILKGYDDAWTAWSNRTEANYTNLPGGDYEFKVKARNLYGVESEERRFSFYLATPWYLRTWAFFLYGFLLVGLVVFIAWLRIRQLERAKRRLEAIVEERTEELATRNAQLALEKKETEKQRDRAEASEAAKEQFFANMTHELRTPLTLIMGPVEQMVQDRDQATPRNLNLVQRNAQKLLRLINQLLDIAKVESQRLELKPVALDLVRFLRDITENFRAHAIRKGLELEFKAEAQPLITAADPEKLEKVMFNLLSNALKFTEKGRVEVQLSSSKDGQQLEIVVKDSGSGIPEADLPHVFDRFYQSQNQKTGSQGTGIGLALSRELVELHGGNISVKSIPGLGSEFRVVLPITQTEGEEAATALSSGNEAELYQVDETERGPAVNPPNEEELVGESVRPLLLLVEDNPDVREYVRSCVDGIYRIVEAGNGQQGLELARKYVPDLVVSDIMMPEMDGNELTRHLKAGDTTSHIPIILLTSLSRQDDKRAGLKTGADAYLTKPFDPEELRIRLENLLELRQTLREKYRAEVLMKPVLVEATSMEEKFLLDVKEKVQAHLADERFSVEVLSEEMGMSRVQLHRKFKALTDSTPSKFIRKYRLDVAREMLQNKVATVAEVAYDCGFSSASYFSKCFSEEFGEPPSAVLDK